MIGGTGLNEWLAVLVGLGMSLGLVGAAVYVAARLARR